MRVKELEFFRALCKNGVDNMLDKQIGESILRDGVCITFIANECLSIIENAGLMGVPIPARITQAIDVLLKKGE